MLSFSVLRVRDFRLLLCTRMFGVMAMQAQAIIVGWQVYSITKDPFMLGLTGLVEAVPAILCALVSGHIVDTNRPHRVLQLCLGVLALNTLLLWLIAGGVVTTSPSFVLTYIFCGVFISGLARSFIMPSAFSLLPQIVPRADIPAASAWMSSSFQFAAIGGPAIAGLIYGGYGAQAAWLIPTALMSTAFVLLFGVSAVPRHFKSGHVREAAFRSILAGWKFILNNPVLLSVMALDMFAVLFGGAVAMLPAYADQVLHVGSEGLGTLRAAPAMGAIVTALILAVRPLKCMRATTLLAAVAGFGICMIGFGVSELFWLSMVFLALGGACDSVSMVMRGTLVQWLTPEAMRGRVSAVNSMFIISSNELGAFESGLAARMLGLVPSVVFGGCCTLGIVVLTALGSRKFRQTVIRADELPKA